MASEMTEERVAELRRLLARAQETDAALERVLDSDEETIALAGSDDDDAQDALTDALREDAEALLSAATRLRAAEELSERRRRAMLWNIYGSVNVAGCTICENQWPPCPPGAGERHASDCTARPGGEEVGGGK